MIRGLSENHPVSVHKPVGAKNRANLFHIPLLQDQGQYRDIAAQSIRDRKMWLSDRVAGGLLPLCQFLLDFYLDFSDRARNEEAKLRAQELAGSLIRCLHAVRAQG